MLAVVGHQQDLLLSHFENVEEVSCGVSGCGSEVVLSRVAVRGGYELSATGGRGDGKGELKVCRGYEICVAGGGAALMRCQRLVVVVGAGLGLRTFWAGSTRI